MQAIWKLLKLKIWSELLDLLNESIKYIIKFYNIEWQNLILALNSRLMKLLER